MNLLEDIYYQKEYISLYLKDEEEIVEFNYSQGDFFFINIAIKKPIKKIGEIILEEKYFDIETAYGYGGIYCNTNDDLFLKKALKNYREYCKDNQVIADFSRIHPFNSTHKYIKEYYNLYVFDRKTISVDTALSNPERWSNYSAKVRNILRKCKSLNLFIKDGTYLNSKSYVVITKVSFTSDGYFFANKLRLKYLIFQIINDKHRTF